MGFSVHRGDTASVSQSCVFLLCLALFTKCSEGKRVSDSICAGTVWAQMLYHFGSGWQNI